MLHNSQSRYPTKEQSDSQGRISDALSREVLLGIVHVDLLPALIRRTPVVTLSNPRSKPTVQIQVIVVAHDNLEPLFYQVRQLRLFRITVVKVREIQIMQTSLKLPVLIQK